MAATGFDVKKWMTCEGGLPSVDAIRPAVCPRCEAAARDREKLQIVGHGQNVGRYVRYDDSGVTQTAWLRLRRYLCRVCKHAWRVYPVDVVAHVLYATSLIAAILAQWTHQGRSEQKLRQAHSESTADSGTWGRWRSLRRWVTWAERLFGTGAPTCGAGENSRRVGKELVSWLWGRSPPEYAELSLPERVAWAVRSDRF